MYESTFQTDASFEDAVVDYVGLLCVQTAKSGGWNQLVSGYSAAAFARSRSGMISGLRAPTIAACSTTSALPTLRISGWR